MSITPISEFAALQGSPLKTGAATTQGAALPFDNVLKQAMQNLEETQAQSTRDSYSLSVGEVDIEDLAMIQINSLKAEYAAQTFISLRDKALDVYSEIMRINV